MLKYLVFLAAISYINCVQSAALSSLAQARSTELIEPVPIVSQDSQIGPEGNFKWSYESGDGTKVEQQGEVKTLDKSVVESLSGSYSYQDPEGLSHVVHYVANENGFLPSGDDIAPEIIRNLEYIATHPHPIETEES